MTDMQTILLGKIKDAAEANNFVFVQQPNWANNGDILLLAPGEINPKIAIHYNFQQCNAILSAAKISRGKRKYFLPQAHRPNYYDFYLQYGHADMDKLFKKFMTKLNKAMS